MKLDHSGANTVVICDTEPIAIHGLGALLGPCHGLRIVGTETSLAAGIATVGERKPGLVVIDKAFGFNAIIDWVRALGDRGAAAVVWGSNINQTEALLLIQAGARAVVRKTAPIHLVTECLGAAAEGRCWLDPVLHAPRLERPVRQARLTQREWQVVELVEQGLRNKDIATLLGIRAGTVKIHVKHIFEKTGVRARHELATSGLPERVVPELAAN